jgi:para-aminobenzoate synthetase component 1
LAGLLPGWFLRVSYELGEVLEPATTRIHPPQSGHSSAPTPSASQTWPLAEAARLDQALIFDHAHNQWYAVGHARRLVALVTDAPPIADPFTLGSLTSQWGDTGYRDAVRTAIELIHAGDCYQVNLAHAMKAPFAGSARALFAALCHRAAPWHGAYMERDEPEGTRRALLSISPELFLSFNAPTRTLSTRPMKGTRRAHTDPAHTDPAHTDPAHADPRPNPLHDLEHSAKDHAELAMIVDMMRNDLGRSAELGTVRVDSPRRIEHHGTGPGAVLQATALVSATLREGVELGNAIADAFPPASVTGAPKIRAMQIIRELELARRDAYCGCIGLRSDRGDLALNVAIRTAMIQSKVESKPESKLEAKLESPLTPGEHAAARDAFTNATLTYHVGAGIVADSDPDAEWRETLDKAGHIAAIADSHHSTTAAHAPVSGDAPISGNQGGHS